MNYMNIFLNTFLPQCLMLIVLIKQLYLDYSISPANGLQRLKISSKLICFLETVRGIPQGLILGLVSFNLFIKDLVFSINETFDDAIIYSCKLNLFVSDAKFCLPPWLFDNFFSFWTHLNTRKSS